MRPASTAERLGLNPVLPGRSAGRRSSLALALQRRKLAAGLWARSRPSNSTEYRGRASLALALQRRKLAAGLWNYMPDFAIITAALWSPS
jgi:hypothetical protein